MKRRILLLIVIVFCVALAVWASRFKAKRVVFSALAVPKLGPTAITIVPGIHLLGGLEPAAAYAVETSDGLVLVDSGLESDASRLKADLRALALDWKQIKAVLLTHVHGDHCGGAQYLRATVQAKVYAGRGDAAVLRSGARARHSSVSSSCPIKRPTPLAWMSSSTAVSRSRSATPGFWPSRPLATPLGAPATCSSAQTSGRSLEVT